MPFNELAEENDGEANPDELFEERGRFLLFAGLDAFACGAVTIRGDDSTRTEEARRDAVKL